MNEATFFLATAAATFVSEDLTCLGVGLLVASGRADLAVGVAACCAGIVLGDLGLWLAGRVAGRALLARLPRSRTVSLDQVGDWLDRHCGRTVVASRFLPGTRLPLYLAAGALGRRAGRFFGWVIVAALLWVPLVVGATALLGEAVAAPLRSFFGVAWPAPFALALLGYGGFRLLRLLANPIGRAKVAARVARLWRWEFWPSWLFYLLLVPYFVWLSLRYRSGTVWLASNPGIPLGGLVGESKYDILRRLEPSAIIPSMRLPEGGRGERLAALRGAAFPLVLKPDASQRGAGVRKVRDLVEAEKYLASHPEPVLVQPYHAGPFEAGIFYVRRPGEARGRIFSITDKVFPAVVGDGVATLTELIWRHPRYRMQAATFLTRHAADADRVLAAGEPFRLALAGNHCQGTLFRDGEHLRTAELEAAIDAVARPFAGFFVGRFDVRYADVAEFQKGRGFAVVELNGATSESTNLYDPTWSLARAYRTLFRQWRMLFEVGAANRARGHRPPSLGEVFRTVRAFAQRRHGDDGAD